MNRSIVMIMFWVLLGSGGVVLGAAPSDPINLKADIVYKTTAEGDLHLDLYYPAVELAGVYPLVIYTHGGGWAAGSKDKARGGAPIGRVVRGLTEAGFCVAAVDYRLCRDNGAKIRDCVTDAMDAVRYLARHGEELHIDSGRVFTYGDSAGGQLAQMLLLAPVEAFPGAAELAGQRYTMVAGVSWYGPCDFEKTELFNPDGRPNFRDRFGGRIVRPGTGDDEKLRLFREVSPVNYLRKNSPPLLMIQGDGDTTIPVHHAYYMQKKAKAIGAAVDIMIVDHAGHNWRQAEGVTPIDPPKDDIVRRTIDFLSARLRREAVREER